MHFLNGYTVVFVLVGVAAPQVSDPFHSFPFLEFFSLKYETSPSADNRMSTRGGPS